MGGPGGAQRPILRVKEPKKTGVRSAWAPCAAKTHKLLDVFLNVLKKITATCFTVSKV
jgi:hypothetical protein